MGEHGIVISVYGDELTVSLMRKEACAKCRACIEGLSEKEMILTVKNGCDAREHDRVNIEMDAGHAIKAVMIMYGIPLVFFIVGIAAGYLLSPLVGLGSYQEAASIVCGVLGVLAAYLIIRQNDKHVDRSAYKPVATAIVTEQ